jgi:hypothetical protein
VASGTQSGAYVAVRAQRTRDHGRCLGPGSFLFVDNALADDPSALRRIPASALRHHRATLLVRANRPRRADIDAPPRSEGERLGEVIARWGLEMPVGLLHQPVGKEPWIETIQGEPEVDLAEARAIELEALLEWNRAVWKPADYHYRLPSGEHAEGFIKLTDAIREPRDAEVLASWLMPHMRDGVGFVLDTGTLTPVYEAAARRAGLIDVPVAVLEHYPRTFVDVHDAFEQAAGGEGRVLAILSVNSSGSVRDRIVAAMREITGLVDPQLVVMVDKERPAERLELIETWLPLPGHDPLIRRGAPARETCELCSDPKRSRLIPINPFTFDGTSQGEMAPIMPSTRDAQANWRLWQASAEAGGAVAVEGRSANPSAIARPSSHPMAVRLDVETLLGSDDFRELVRSRVGLVGDGFGAADDPLTAVRFTHLPFRPCADLVLVPEHEYELDEFPAFWQALGPSFAPDAELAPFPVEGDFGADLEAKIESAKEILIFALGSVSGHSLQRALFAVQRSPHRDRYGLQGFVLHARLPTLREWETLCNSFDRCLHAGWIFFLPDSSPLRQEEKLLKRLDTAAYAGAREEFLVGRLRLCAGEVTGHKPALFWGSGADARLTQNSIYGQELDARTTFAAVGAAMARARADFDRATPQPRVFDLAGMLRSYYDPLIIASFFRWLGPYEAWWGWKAEDARRTIDGIFGRVGDDRGALSVIVPELLLARAQGKVHDAAAEVILAEADRLTAWADEELAAAVAIGLDLDRTPASPSSPSGPSPSTA